MIVTDSEAVAQKGVIGGEGRAEEKRYCDNVSAH
jgi:hypothetical protein